MTIYDKGLIRAMKQAYRDGGYDVAVTDHGVLIQADGWGVEILGEAVPNSVKSLIVLHNGSLPRMDSAVHVSKGGCADSGNTARPMFMIMTSTWPCPMHWNSGTPSAKNS